MLGVEGSAPWHMGGAGRRSAGSGRESYPCHMTHWDRALTEEMSRTPKPRQMQVSKERSQAEIAADIRLLGSLRGSGSTIFAPGFDCDSNDT